MASPQTGPEQEFLDLRAQILAAYDDAVRAIESIPRAQTAFECATELANDLRRLADEAARVRAKTVVRIRDSEKLSLAGLAERLSVSRARADQIVKAASKPDQPEER